MRNKAVGPACAPPAKSTGGLRAGRGEGRLRAPSWRRASWPPLRGEEVSAGLGFPAAKRRGLHSPYVLVTALVIPPPPGCAAPLPKLLKEKPWVFPGMSHLAAGCAAPGPREKLGGPGRPRGRVAAFVQRL